MHASPPTDYRTRCEATTRPQPISSRKRCLALLGLTALQTSSLVHVRALSTFPVLRPSYYRLPRTAATMVRKDDLHGSVPITKESLQKLTVKQLKEKIKGLDVPVKISQLKLKSDLVNFLLDLHSNSDDQNRPPPSSPPAAVAATTSKSSTVRIKRPRSMPPLHLPTVTTGNTNTNTNRDNGNGQSNDASQAPPPAPTKVSPKDIIFEHVLTRYPPLRDLQVAIIEQKEAKEEHNNDISTHMHPNFYKSFSGLGELDVRQKYHPIMKDMTSSDLDIVTVGTASCVPGVTRGVSCTALRLQWRRNGNPRNGRGDEGRGGKKVNGGRTGTDGGRGKSGNSNDPTTGGIWIFDCGESTQLQIQRTGSIRPGKISKIFITHAHGDHSFGLPGLMCIMGQDRDRDGPPLEIYGPEGIRMWLRTCVRYSVSRIVPPYRVHELMDIPMSPEWSQGRYKNGRYFYQLDNRGSGNRWKGHWGTQGLAGEDPMSFISRAPMLNLEPSSQFGEIEGGRDIYPIYNHPKCVDGAPIWEVEDEGDVKVHAAPMSHGVPCVGYVVEEEDKPGRLRSDLVEPIAKRNIKALKQAGMRIPMKVMATIKDLPEGGSYKFPDGTVVHQKDVVEPPREGRKVVVCGDTADSRAIAGLAKGADVLIHEATNAFLSGIDKDTSKEEVAKDARIHGHSTPGIAGNFAKEIGAKRLILNHFSSRYKGDQSLESMSIMTRIEQEAIKASGLAEDKVAAAWDFMVLPVPQN